MNQQQQLARQYLATLVKSDNLSVTSSETEISLTGEMVDQLLEILKTISSEARDRLPSYERTNKSIHNSMEELQLDSPDEFDRGSIRRSFRTIKRRLRNKCKISSINRPSGKKKASYWSEPIRQAIFKLFKWFIFVQSNWTI